MKRSPLRSRPSLLPAALRRQVAERAGYHCECCGEAAPWVIGVVHHRKRRRDGGDLPSNLLWLKPSHHADWHDHPIRARAAGVIVSVFDDPAVTAVLLHGYRLVLLGESYTDVPGDAA